VDDEQPPEDLAGRLDRVDQALQRLDDGTYGTCEVCGAPLPDETLAADPTARRCVDHQP
jgi:RNA polymerase-binding transcription factor DksA